MKFKIAFTLVLVFSLFQTSLFSNTTTTPKPKLVVGIVIDQMKYDYLNQFKNHFGKGGFMRLMNEGMNCVNTNYNYIPTYTGPGHASIYTGTTPAVHGIVGNEWYDHLQKKILYCVSDTTVSTIGTTTLAAGKMSPKNLLSNTIGDELKFFTAQKSKVIGIALKDRGAILPAGHSANAAFWFDGVSGNWITSSYYMPLLPKWVNDFNAKQEAQTFAKQDWNLLEPLQNYLFAKADSNSWESKYALERAPQFPHLFSKFATPNSDIIRATPWGNTFTKDFAIATIEGEQLGMGNNTDMLTVSFSSTDYVGHQFGPNSLEVEDMYARLDKDLEQLFSYLDTKFGKENVLVFLTADHGVAPVPGYAAENHLHGGVVMTQPFIDSLKSFLDNRLGKAPWIKAYENQQIYLNADWMKLHFVEKNYVVQLCKDYFIQHKTIAIADVYATSTNSCDVEKSVYASFIKNGFYENRCGDLLITYNPGWIENMTKGTTHGTFYSYDTHVPLLFWGYDIPKATITHSVAIIDIAPTVAAKLKIPMPNGATGKCIQLDTK